MSVDSDMGSESVVSLIGVVEKLLSIESEKGQYLSGHLLETWKQQ